MAVDNIYATPVMLNDIQRNQPKTRLLCPQTSVASFVQTMAKQMDSDLAIIDKRRPAANQAEIMNIIGEVSGRTCLIVGDIVDTAGTLCNAAKALKEQGAKAGGRVLVLTLSFQGAPDNLNDSALTNW